MARNGTWGSRRYNSIESDPETDRLREAFQKENKIFRNSELAVIAGLHGGTVNNLLGGKTKRPQHATYMKAYAALGIELQPVKVEKINYETELVEARAQFKEHRAALKKKRDAAKNRRRK